ncbi:MAG: host attachment protein, partial [Deltaproteobacteria bacterium]
MSIAPPPSRVCSIPISHGRAIMADTWILVADSARARVFEVTREDPTLREVAAFTNPEGRIAQRELRH